MNCEFLSGADDVVDPDDLHVDVQRGRHRLGGGARTDEAEVDGVGAEGLDDVTAGVELAPRDVGVGHARLEPPLVADDQRQRVVGGEVDGELVVAPLRAGVGGVLAGLLGAAWI